MSIDTLAKSTPQLSEKKIVRTLNKTYAELQVYDPKNSLLAFFEFDETGILNLSKNPILYRGFLKLYAKSTHKPILEVLTSYTKAMQKEINYYESQANK